MLFEVRSQGPNPDPNTLTPLSPAFTLGTSFFLRLLQFVFLGSLIHSMSCSAYYMRDIGILTPGSVVTTTLVSAMDVAVNESESEAVFTLMLNAPAPEAVTVAFETSDGTAVSGSDYLANTGTVTFEQGQTTREVSVALIDDSLFEGDEHFFLNLVSVSRGEIFDSRGRATLSENEPGPSLTIEDVTVDEDDGSAQIRVALAPMSAVPVSVDFSTMNGSANAGTDYTAVSGQLQFVAGDVEEMVVVPVLLDGMDEPQQNFFVKLANATLATLADDEGEVRINDIDAPVSLSIGDRTCGEGAVSGLTPCVFTISKSGTTLFDSVIQVRTVAGGANPGTPGTDYDGLPLTTFTFPASVATFDVSVMIRGDAIDEVNETFRVELVSATNATIADGLGEGIITDNDNPTELRIGDRNCTPEGTGANTFCAFTITKTGLTSFDSEIVVSTMLGSTDPATPGVDYVALTGAVFTIPAAAMTFDVTVEIVGDAIDEIQESFRVDVISATFATIIDFRGEGSIVDDDLSASLAINNRNCTEADAGVTPCTFTITKLGLTALNISVVVQTAPGTVNPAISGVDFQALNQVVTFAPAETSKTVDVLILGETLEEADETFFVNLSGEMNAVLIDGQGLGTILANDNAPPTLTVLSLTPTILPDGVGMGTVGLPLPLKIAENGNGVIVLQAADSSWNFIAPNFTCSSLPSFMGTPNFNYALERITLTITNAAPTGTYLFSCAVTDTVFSTSFHIRLRVAPDCLAINWCLGAFSGSGTEADPFPVCNRTDLDNIRHCSEHHYVQRANISLSGSNFEMIPTFTGSFNGNDGTTSYQIQNLEQMGPLTGNAGLFFSIGVSGAGPVGVLRNITLVNPTIDGNNGPVFFSAGALVAYAASSAVIENARVIGGNIGAVAGSPLLHHGGLVGVNEGSILGSKTENVNLRSFLFYPNFQAVGGLVGSNSGIVDCQGQQTLGGFPARAHMVGGLVGFQGGVDGLAGDGTERIVNCMASSFLPNPDFGSPLFGGLVGKLAGGHVENSSATLSSVTGMATYPCHSVGGLVGRVDAGAEVRDSDASGDVLAFCGDLSDSEGVGGLVGVNYGFISRSFHRDGVVDSTSSAGGLAGRNMGGVIEESFSSETTIVRRSFGFGASTETGGLVGLNQNGTIVSSYSLASLDNPHTSNNVGGLVGLIQGGNFVNVYAASPFLTFTGFGYGRFAGGLQGGYTFQDCFYDTTLAGPPVGIPSSPFLPELEGKTTAEMQMQATYPATWTFGPGGVWKTISPIAPQYPELLWE